MLTVFSKLDEVEETVLDLRKTAFGSGTCQTIRVQSARKERSDLEPLDWHYRTYKRVAKEIEDTARCSPTTNSDWPKGACRSSRARGARRPVKLELFPRTRATKKASCSKARTRRRRRASIFCRRVLRLRNYARSRGLTVEVASFSPGTQVASRNHRHHRRAGAYSISNTSRLHRVQRVPATETKAASTQHVTVRCWSSG